MCYNVRTSSNVHVRNMVVLYNIRGLSGKFEDTVNTEAKTSNNFESFLFVFWRTIKQYIHELNSDL